MQYYAVNSQQRVADALHISRRLLRFWIAAYQKGGLEASVACMLPLTACVATPHTLPPIQPLLISGVGCVPQGTHAWFGVEQSIHARPSEPFISDGLFLSDFIKHIETKRK